MRRAAIVSIAIGVSGCAVGGSEDGLSSTLAESFEEFRAKTYRESFEGGLYIVDGDTPVVDDKALYEVWERQTQGALIVDVVGDSDDVWTLQQVRTLTYCISNNFGSNKPAIVAAMREATELIGWETMANVDFTYVPTEDASCSTSNPNVVFSVKQVSNQPYLARAFFPSSPQAARDVLVDRSSFEPSDWSLSRVLGHELGHVLGFRHEHTRPEAGTCFEDDAWRPLTPYDSASIMHYPQCNGASGSLDWSESDRIGVQALYGVPGGTPEPEPEPAHAAQTTTRTGSVAQGQSRSAGSYDVLPGTTFTAIMTGYGDPDLYVRFGLAPTKTRFNCRPYLDGPDEECTLDVPASATKAYVSVTGYTAATYEVTVTWTP